MPYSNQSIFERSTHSGLTNAASLHIYIRGAGVLLSIYNAETIVSVIARADLGACGIVWVADLGHDRAEKGSHEGKREGFEELHIWFVFWGIVLLGWGFSWGVFFL